MAYKNPEDMSLEEIREQLAIYNRLYYNLRKEDEAYMQKKRIRSELKNMFKCIILIKKI